MRLTGAPVRARRSNVIHGSDGEEGAKSEIPLWFKEGEVINIDSTKWPHHVGLYLYDTTQA